MTAQNPRPYSAATIGLHWLTLALLVGVYACIELREFYPRGSDIRAGLKTWHFQLGLTVFALAWARLLFRLTPKGSGAVSHVPTGPRWAHLLARVGHAVLYALILGLPLAGWVILSAEGDPVPFWGLQLPPLTAPDKGLAESVEDLHKLGGTIGYVVIGLHAIVALFHHYVLRDGVLIGMVPWLRARAVQS